VEENGRDRLTQKGMFKMGGVEENELGWVGWVDVEENNGGEGERGGVRIEEPYSLQPGQGTMA
jgi:hypothetical protein